LVQTYAGVRRLGMQHELRRRNDELWQQQLTRAATAYARRCEPIARQGYRHFEIRDKVKDAAGICSVLLTPHDGHPLPEFLPGQYLTLRLQIPGQSKPTVRCYSLSDRHHPDHYRITVKRQEALGVASAYIHDQLRIGDLVEVRAPTGSFHLDPHADTPVVLVAAGIGITPILSMLLAIASENPQRDVWLFFGVRDGSRHIQRRTLERLQRELPRLHLRISYSRPCEQDRLGRDYHAKGRITVEYLRQELPGRDFDFYLCGPPEMVRSLRSGLANWGVLAHRIHVETFSALPTDEESDLQPARRMLVRFARSGTTLSWDGKDASLLELAARHGIDIESGCRAGNCGTCAVAVRSGTVRYTSEHDAAAEEGSCLTCIAVPDGDLELEA
jgi:ferredoxin-NADP reductase